MKKIVISIMLLLVISMTVYAPGMGLINSKKHIDLNIDQEKEIELKYQVINDNNISHPIKLEVGDCTTRWWNGTIETLPSLPLSWFKYQEYYNAFPGVNNLAYINIDPNNDEFCNSYTLMSGSNNDGDISFNVGVSGKIYTRLYNGECVCPQTDCIVEEEPECKNSQCQYSLMKQKRQEYIESRLKWRALKRTERRNR